jgi:bifunctional non-homologous end joining protein LigD
MYISLFYNQGSSNKVYNLDIRQVDDSFELYAVYGRVGKPMRQNLIDCFDTIEGATEEAERRAHLKKLKGYAEDSNTQVSQVLDTGLPTTDILPQLANPIKDEAKLRKWIEEHDICMQVKHDGERRIAGVENGVVVASNRRGQGVTLHPAIAAELLHVYRDYLGEKDFLLDGEDMGDCFIVFDVIKWAGTDVRELSYANRFGWVLDANIWSPFQYSVGPILLDEPVWPSAVVDEDVDGDDLDHVAVENFRFVNHFEEGIILRDAGAAYTAGRPNSGGPIIKLKNVASATVVASQRNGSKRSIEMALGDLPIGNVTIPPNYDIPEPGELIEVEYLYAYRRGCLYQPVYKGPRPDKEFPDAYDSLRWKDDS